MRSEHAEFLQVVHLSAVLAALDIPAPGREISYCTTLTVYWGYIYIYMGIMEKKVETIIYWSYMGKIEN